MQLGLQLGNVLFLFGIQGIKLQREKKKSNFNYFLRANSQTDTKAQK
jgi:hypothetical protein